MLTYFISLASKILTNIIFIIILLHVQMSRNLSNQGNGTVDTRVNKDMVMQTGQELRTVVPGGPIGQLKVTTKAWTSTVA